jgi:hypothetical protein
LRVWSPELITQSRETQEVAAWLSNPVDMGTSQKVAREDMEEKAEIRCASKISDVGDAPDDNGCYKAEMTNATK